MVNQGMLPSQDGNKQADEETDIVYQYTKNYIKAVGKGLLKVFSKMGISTLQSYCSAQIFEIVGLDQDFICKIFPRHRQSHRWRRADMRSQQRV